MRDGAGFFAHVVRAGAGFSSHRLEARNGPGAGRPTIPQHFNTGPQPARYLATAVGGLRYPTLWAQRVSLLGASAGDKPAVAKSVKESGDQIEYEDQDPRVHRIWLGEMRNGATPQIEKFIPTPEDLKALA